MNRPLLRLPLRSTGTASFWKWFRWLFVVAFLVAVAVAVRLVQIEMDTSRLQARYLSELTSEVGFTVSAGPSDNIRFPKDGPYDIRLGYTLLPSIERRLRERGFSVASQARDSDRMLSLADDGLFMPYQEKDQAGLRLYDVAGEPLFGDDYPKRVYVNFAAIPPLVVNALLFIEDRRLLDADQPNRNPAIDWGRLGRAVADQGERIFNHGQPTTGGSTLATQIEKFRHSPGGRTATPQEKLRQVASASLRAYLDGPRTLDARQQIVVRYLNSVPLAAQPGIGEINGIGDGLAAWYGRNFDDVNRMLAAPQSEDNLAAQGLAFRQVLSLMIAQRGPSHFLLRRNEDLAALTDSYLRLLANGGAISLALRDAALAAPIEFHRAQLPPPTESFVSRKAVTSLRSHLMGALGVSNLYDLDRLDLSVTATLDDEVQQAVSERLASVATRDGARAAGLYGKDMLRTQDDPSKISYSFTLFEMRDGANLTRVQTDSVNQPLDINQGARLNLGSTAKLRTIVTYLQAIAELHGRYGAMSAEQLREVQPDRMDALSRWAVDYLAHTQDRTLTAMLDASVERKYSGSAGEMFFTGGGGQVFSNFESSDNARNLTVHRAFQHSVNLVFVRIMRDIVHYQMIQTSGPPSQWLDDPVARKMYLTRFADQESRVYMTRFYTKYHGKSADDALASLMHSVRKSPPKVATVLRSVAPDAAQPWFDAQMRSALKGTPAASILDDEDLAKLYTKYGIDKFNLNDRGYISSVHPLELWTANYLRAHPAATLNEVQEASSDARTDAYKWLFKTRYHNTQDRRIKRMVEQRAYEEIGKSWRALGYPFAKLTPSYAAAIGASGDRPVALAQLIGIIANDGKEAPTQSISELEFAKGTPYETRFTRAAAQPEQVLQPEIANVVHMLTRDVVTGGTARRLAQGITFPNGQTLQLYGKTGTGDQRFNVFARGGRLIESRKVNRTATFVFVLGDRFYGTLTAFVHEPYASHFDFTSALSVQLLKTMAPALEPLLDQAPARASRRVAAANAADSGAATK
jgi:membrane peptidoglycan carboxypeptidase